MIFHSVKGMFQEISRHSRSCLWCLYSTRHDSKCIRVSRMMRRAEDWGSKRDDKGSKRGDRGPKRDEEGLLPA